MLGRCGSVLSWSWSVYLFHCISFRERFPMSGGRFQGAHGCLLGVRYRPISCVSVRSCSSRSVPLPACRLVVASWLSARFSSRLSRRGGGAAAGGCLLVRFIATMGRAMLPHFVPFLFLACSLRGAGRLGVWSSVSSCLLGDGAASMCGVPCLFQSPCRAIACPLPVGAWSGRMR